MGDGLTFQEEDVEHKVIQKILQLTKVNHYQH